ncbi:hypothetical protein WN944_015870 [Citrus x changshan-huyou]|uniref:TIR domain-containing protein n=1 Tax=Citrus x changshan-huyou TaxID=2935761 RepID=A0AAP0M9U4_9ROSI
MASSSFGLTSQTKYDVFLSFRGEDTRDNFTSHLHAALCRKKIKTFIDEELNRGDEISLAILKAIEGSKISVIIFSKNYASSKWCLDELVKILQCHKINGQMVIPVFYRVDPSDVRKQSGRFKDAFVKHAKQFKDMPEKIQNWRAVLTEASNLSGWDSMTIRSEAQLVEGTDVIAGIFLDLSKIRDIHLGSRAFENMTNLRLLKFYLPNRRGDPIMSSKVHLDQVTLSYFGKKKSCINLAEFPKISGNIKVLKLARTWIEEVPSSIESLTNLEVLDLAHCKRLNRLSASICKLKSLSWLRLYNCSKLESFPGILENMARLEYIDLRLTAIKELPSSVEHLEGLKELRMEYCHKLGKLPDNLGSLSPSDHASIQIQRRHMRLKVSLLASKNASMKTMQQAWQASSAEVAVMRTKCDNLEG